MEPRYLLIIPIIQVLLGIVALRRDARNRQNWSFSLLMFAISGWATMNLSEQYFPQEIHTYIGRLIYAFASLAGGFALVFALSTDNKEKNKHLLIGPIVLGVIFFLFSLTPAVVEYDIVYPSGHTDAHYGWGHPVFAGYFLSFILLTNIVLIQKFRRTDGVQKYKIGYILLGLIITLLIAIPTNLILPLTGQSNLANVGPVSSIFLTLFTAYAILKYRFLDVRVVVRRSLVYGILFSMFAGLVAFFVILLAHALENQFTLNSWVAAAVIALLISSAFYPFKKTIQRFVDLMMRKTDESHMAQAPEDVRELLTKAPEVMQNVLKIENARMYLVNQLAAAGWRAKEQAALEEHFEKNTKALLLQEIPYRREDTRMQLSTLSTLEHTMFDKDIAVVAPMFTQKRELVGCFLLGPKPKDSIYTAEEISYIEAFSRGIATRLGQIMTDTKEIRERNYG